MDRPEKKILAAFDQTSRAQIITTSTEQGNLVIFANAAFTTLTGFPTFETIGKNCRFLQGELTNPHTVADIRAALAAGQAIRCEMLNYRKDGSTFWNDLSIDPIRDDTGHVVGFVGMQYDCSEKYAAKALSNDAEHRLSAVADSVPGYIFRRVMRPSGEYDYPYVSRSIYRILGLPTDGDEGGEILRRHLHPDDRTRLDLQIIGSAANLAPVLVEFRMVSSSGRSHWFRSESRPRMGGNGDVVWDGLAVEITSEKKFEETVAHLTDHDPLTGLANRLLFNRTVVRTVANLSGDGCQTALYSIDLDEFQALNDMLGSPMGDKVLRRISLRIREFAESLGGTVARLGGDEFGVLLPTVQTEASALKLAEEIVAEIRRPMMIDGETALVQASVGCTTLPHLSDSSQLAAAEEWGAELLNRANLALQVAKRDGPGASHMYSTDLDDRVRFGPELRKAFKEALHQEQFTLHYQPIVNLVSGVIVGAEALLRWEHPKLGLQRPDLFIPLAEATGWIVPLGAWVLKNAMRQAEAWKREGLPPIRIALNVSSIQIQKPGFLDMVRDALRETGADPSQFELELTEGILLQASADVMSLFETLRDMGFGLVIDDFGTGHATLAYLRSYAVDKLKIDQVFVRHLVLESSDAAIIQAVVLLCRRMNLQVVAEGIETAVQRDFLVQEGCTYGQGYLFSMPLRAEDLGWVLRHGKTLPIQADLS